MHPVIRGRFIALDFRTSLRYIMPMNKGLCNDDHMGRCYACQ